MFWLRFYAVKKGAQHFPPSELTFWEEKYKCSVDGCYFDDPKNTKTLFGKGLEEPGIDSDESDEETSIEFGD